jgi:MFS family permease
MSPALVGCHPRRGVVMGSTSGQATDRRALRADFGLFWAGQTISNLGSSFTLFALPLLVFKLTGSPLDLGVTSATSFLPYLLFGLVLGAWVDRVDRRRLMIATDLARALVIALIPLLSAAGLLEVWWLYAIAFANATLTVAFDTAAFAAVPSLVASKDDLVKANGRIQASYSAAQVAGPLLAGLLLTAVPVQQVFWADAASFLLSAASLAAIRRRFNAAADPGQTRRSVRADIAEGLRFVLRHPVLRSISAMMALINLINATTYAQLVVFAKQRLAAADTQVGYLYAAGSLGVVVLSLAAGPLRRRLRFSQVALGALLLMGLLIAALSRTDRYWLALPLWAAIAGLGILFNINTTSLRQQLVPSELLGRIASVAMVLAWSAIPLGTLAGGWAVEQTGSTALVYLVIGLAVAAIAGAFWLSPLGHAERYLVAASEAAGERGQP